MSYLADHSGLPPQRRILLKKGAAARRAGNQAPAATQDAEEYAKKIKCEKCLIEYYVGLGDRMACPMCNLQRNYDEVRASLIQAQNEVQVLRNQNSRLQVQTDLQAAIRAALEILDDGDYAWLKAQMYQYKIDKSVMLKPTHGRLLNGKRPKRGEKLPPNGFMTMPRDGDPEAHACSSLGGLAMAEYLDEAISTFGSAQAMGIMLKAWWKVLPGGLS